MRQLDTVAENQAKLTKTLQHLSKKGVVSTTNGVEEGGDSNGRKRKGEDDKSGRFDPLLNWARNLLLVGDGHWQSLKDVDDLSLQILKLESDYNFRVVSRPDEVLARLYDGQRGKLLFALPPHTDKVSSQS